MMIVRTGRVLVLPRAWRKLNHRWHFLLPRVSLVSCWRFPALRLSYDSTGHRYPISSTSTIVYYLDFPPLPNPLNFKHPPTTLSLSNTTTTTGSIIAHPEPNVDFIVSIPTATSIVAFEHHSQHLPVFPSRLILHSRVSTSPSVCLLHTITHRVSASSTTTQSKTR
jgi:hypothetical protein